MFVFLNVQEFPVPRDALCLRGAPDGSSAPHGHHEHSRLTPLHRCRPFPSTCAIVVCTDQLVATYPVM